jgi:hypothetical protein
MRSQEFSTVDRGLAHRFRLNRNNLHLLHEAVDARARRQLRCLVLECVHVLNGLVDASVAVTVKVLRLVSHEVFQTLTRCLVSLLLLIDDHQGVS